MNVNLTKARVTLRDVAKKLNVSHTTVSRALQNDPRISIGTRERVQQTARQMGHRPDPMLSALAHYRHHKITRSIGSELAWFNAWPDPKQLRRFKEFDQYWCGALAEAERSGFRLEEFAISKEMSLQRIQRILQTRNIRGILLPPLSNPLPDCESFAWDEFCIVRFGHSMRYPRTHLVTSDQLTDGMIAFENIWKHGYRRIGLVTSKKMNTRFGAGYFFSQMKWCPDTRLPALVMNAESHAQDSLLLKRWLKANRPDAILTDVRELRDMLDNLGYRAGQNIGLAALSVLDGNADAGIDQNSWEIGKAAVQMLISLINHNERGIPEVCRELLIEGKWVDGSTLPPKA